MHVLYILCFFPTIFSTIYHHIYVCVIICSFPFSFSINISVGFHPLSCENLLSFSVSFAAQQKNNNNNNNDNKQTNKLFSRLLLNIWIITKEWILFSCLSCLSDQFIGCAVFCVCYTYSIFRIYSLSLSLFSDISFLLLAYFSTIFLSSSMLCSFTVCWDLGLTLWCMKSFATATATGSSYEKH